MVLPAGQRDRRITIERQVRTVDARFSSPVVAWVPDVTVWARKIESSVTPESNPGVPDGVVTYARPTKYVIRWRIFDPTTMRINDGGRVLRVTGTAELGRRTELELACQEWAHEQH